MAIAAPWFNLNFSNHSFVKSYVAAIGIGILMLVTLWRVHANTQQITFNLSWLKISWLFLFMIGTISISWSVYVDFSVTKWMMWFITFCAFIVSYRLQLDKTTLIKFCWGLLITALIIAIIGIAQYLFDLSVITQAAPPASTFANKNMATQPIVLILPFTLFLLFHDKIKGIKVWVVTVSIALIMAYIFYTRTRASWVSIVIEVFLLASFLIVKRKNIKQWTNWNKSKTQSSIVATLLFFILVFFDLQSSSLAIKTTSQIRFDIWQVAINMIEVSPFFGSGLGSWFYNETEGGFGVLGATTFTYVHNDLLELGVELGVLGVMALLLSVVTSIVAVFKIVDKDDTSFAWFYYLIWVALAGSFVQMQFSFPYQLALPSLLLGLYLGMIAQRSELFIPSVKTIQIKKSVKSYKYIVKSFASVIVIGVFIIYANWFVMHDDLNTMVKTNKISQIQNIKPVYARMFPITSLNQFSEILVSADRVNGAIIIDRYLLNIFPNYSHTLLRYAKSLMKKKHYETALKVVTKLKSVAVKGYYKRSLMVEAEIYLNTGKIDKFRQIFDEIVTYQYGSHLNKWILFHYKHYKHYNCFVEKKIVDILIKQKDYRQARNRIEQINDGNRDAECLSPIVKLLQDKEF